MAREEALTARPGQRWLLAALLLICAAGIALRFTNLGARSFTNDEATTSIRVAGSSLAEWAQLFDGRVRTVGQLLPYQTLVPGRTTLDTVRALAAEDPQHPPLYYVLDRWWIELAGTSVAERRLPSALFGSLAIVAAYFLGAELGGALAGLLLAALIAMSPFHLIYAQQAREYALWTLLALASTALLLVALRSGRIAAWVGYGVAIAAGLYTDLLFADLLIAHAVIVTLVSTQRRRALATWAAVAAVAAAAYVPWIIPTAHRASQLTNNTFLGAHLPFTLFTAKVAFNASVVFVDMMYRNAAALVLLPVLAAIWCWALIALVRQRDARALIVTLALGLIPTALLIGYDVLHHESRSTAARYLVPTWIALELVIALAAARALASSRRMVRLTAGAAIVFVLAIGAASNLAERQADWTWADSSTAPLRSIADHVNAAPAALLVFRDDPARWDFTVAQLINALRPDVRVQLLGAAAPLARAGVHAGTTLLLDPGTATLLAARRAGFTPEPLTVDAPSVGGIARRFRADARQTRAAQRVSDDRLSLWLLQRPLAKQ